MILPLLAALASAGPDVEHLDFLLGTWRGTHEGATIEEVWQPQLGPTMVGTFRMVGEREAKFYEFMVIEDVHPPVMRIKHFGNDFVAWEDKGEHTAMTLTELDGEMVVFANDVGEALKYTVTGKKLVIELQQGEKMTSFELEKVK